MLRVPAEAEADQKLEEDREADLSFSALYAPVRALFCADPQLLEQLAQCSTHLARLQLLITLQVQLTQCLTHLTRYDGNSALHTTPNCVLSY